MPQNLRILLTVEEYDSVENDPKDAAELSINKCEKWNTNT